MSGDNSSHLLSASCIAYFPEVYLPTSLWVMYYYSPFTDGETEAYREEPTLPRSHDLLAAEPNTGLCDLIYR